MGLWCHEKRVDRAVGLTLVTGLAVRLAADRRNAVLSTVENVGRAHQNAFVASDAALSGDEFDHGRAQTLSKPPEMIRWR